MSPSKPFDWRIEAWPKTWLLCFGFLDGGRTELVMQYGFIPMGGGRYEYL